MEAATSGERFGTVTVKLCETDRPPGSVAVTVAVTVPCASATTVTVAPDTTRDTNWLFEEAAA